jgi:hypothetical protein
MKKFMVILTAMMFVFSISAATFAAEQKAAPTPAPAAPAKAEKKVKTKRATGEVVKVDEVEGIIVVKGKKGEDAYLIKDVEWKVYKGAKEVGAGDVVSITYFEKDGKKVAKTVAKKGPAKKAAESAAKPAAPAK